MTISNTYDRYLSHFKETVTLRDFNQRSDTPGLCGLRHDVDHDLDLALEMAHKEHQLGIKASYFILPSAPYWQADKQLLDKCLQLQDYGHEVGLHVNSMADWVSGVTDDITASLTQQLNFLRHAGIDLTGIAAHGDKLCYEHNLSNYWCFEELRPESPYTVENGRTAEGPHEADLAPRLQYPVDHLARRPDGSTFPLWSVSMQSLGLDYHAWHTKFDHYFSDSAGGWKRTPDPIEVARGNERWQVLIHPEHWRGPKKYYFFLSSARSGSKWLSEALAAATPLDTRHEHIFNQAFSRGDTSRKGTTDVWALEDDPNEVNARLTEAWEEFENQPRDFAEVNVYLEGFVSQLRAVFPEAMFIQLKRDPALVVSSLMDRNWYDTPEDRRHPRLDGVNVRSKSQFERVCHYIRQVESRLSKFCTHSIDLENLTKSPETLALELKRLDIVYHPRLGQPIAGRISNARKNKNYPDPIDWNENQKLKFDSIINGAKYDGEIYLAPSPHSNTKFRIMSLVSKYITKFFEKDVRNFVLNASSSTRILTKFCSLHHDKSQSGWVIIPDESMNNAYLAIGGSSWNSAVSRPLKTSGWQTRPGQYIKGSASILILDTTNLSIYAISYCQSGKQIHRRNLGVIDATHPNLEFAFTAHPKASTIDFIVYVPAKFKSKSFTLQSFKFDWVSLTK